MTSSKYVRPCLLGITKQSAAMLEISGNDIPLLCDTDLRFLVFQLAKAEFRGKDYPLSSITAGGNQDAADGGLDIRVEIPGDITNPDFVPRRLTGFQVKKPDMPASAIRNEMRPRGILRNVIRELADASGSYIIVSAQGSVADGPLASRRSAMRNALHDLPNASKLHTDFYDRDRIATWINKYPGVAAWMRGKIGRPLSGWTSIGNSIESHDNPGNPYLFDDKTCLIAESSRAREHLTIAEGIARLRAALSAPRQSIRLIGLSGLGKTRLVEALFENGVGSDPLDPSLAVYTDYSEEPTPTAREMARNLISGGQRAILIVDNCNPTTHSELANLCTNNASKVSLLTVEYDVREDEPERTEVFRLQSASPELLEKWLGRNFPDISQIDRGKITEFSDGNFRVARALAETLGKGETLGRLKSRDLFNRIFQQRNQTDQQLLCAAEDLSLLYSINGEDVAAEGELARVGALRNISASQLFEALVEMRRRGLVQARGRFRAILPQAIANPLAARALERIPKTDFDHFCATLTPRMLKSVSRRLGYLHDSSCAQATVARWLCEDGPLGNLIQKGGESLQIITNIAPVAPEAVLKKIEEQLEGPNGRLIFAPNASDRLQWIRLIRALGYEATMFERAIKLLSHFLASEPEGHNNNSAHAAFAEAFHIYLSGTQALPEQRRAVIKQFALSNDPSLQRCASVGLGALLESHHFSSWGSFDFGARSRDWGWHPKINKNFWDWFNSAIHLAIELTPSLAGTRTILANKVRNLWRIGACHKTIKRAAITLHQTQPWIEGWIALRATLRYDGKQMPESVRGDLEQLITLLKPTDLLNQSRAIILNRTLGSLDFADGEDDGGNEAISAWKKADEMAKDLGRALAQNAVIRVQFLAELFIAPHAQRAFECGLGLAEGAESLNSMWDELVAHYTDAEHSTPNATVLGGFLHQAHLRDKSFALSALEAVIDNCDLAPNLPYFQARVGIDDEGIARLRRAISKGVLNADSFFRIANGVIANAPPEPLAALLEDIASLPNGVGVALDILHMYFFCLENDKIQADPTLILVGRSLLCRFDFKMKGYVSDHDARMLISTCLQGDDARDVAKQVCANVRAALKTVFLYDIDETLSALFKTQPFVALDAFLLPAPARSSHMFFSADFEEGSPIADAGPTTLQQWANRDSHIRYPIIGKCLSMFDKKNSATEDEISPVFLAILNSAPDKRSFIGGLWERLHPRSWSGSLADILIRRMAQVKKEAEQNESLRNWVTEITPAFDKWINQERQSERVREESFE